LLSLSPACVMLSGRCTADAADLSILLNSPALESPSEVLPTRHGYGGWCLAKAQPGLWGGVKEVRVPPLARLMRRGWGEQRGGECCSHKPKARVQGCEFAAVAKQPAQHQHQPPVQGAGTAPAERKTQVCTWWCFNRPAARVRGGIDSPARKRLILGKAHGAWVHHGPARVPAARPSARSRLG
jgi:hypothetical protein